MRAIAEVVAHAVKVHGYMHEPELRWLAETARALTPPAAWCEIGAWQGRSASAVAGALPAGSELVLVDNFTGPTTREMPNAAACRQRLQAEMVRMRLLNPTITIHLVEGFSATVAQGLGREHFDVVFIDGDHAYEKVCADISGYRPTLKPGGLLCGHDFTNRCGVEPAVRELLPGFQQVPHTSLWWVRV